MISLTFTEISHYNAAILLDVSIDTIRKAAKRDVLTRLPTIGIEQKLIQEQVELFKGKSQLRKDLLSSEELRTWLQYKDLSKKYNPTMTEEEKKRLLTVSLIIVGIILLALGTNWYLNHQNEIAEKLSNMSIDIPINEQTSEYLANTLKQLGENTDVSTVFDTFLKEIA